MALTRIVTRKGQKILVTETVLSTNTKGEVQWAVYFVGGGWNSVWASTEKQALSRAEKTYGIEVDSVTVMTPDREKALLSNFW